MKSIMKFIKDNIKPTAVAVAVFIVVLVFAMRDAEAGGTISLGTTVMNSSETFGEIGYRHNVYEANFMLIGEGHTEKGIQDHVNVYSVSRIVSPGWPLLFGKNYYRIGLAYVDDSPLVGNSNYRLGIGIDYGVFSIEYVHFSSAGIHKTNRGIDGIMLKLDI